MRSKPASVPKPPAGRFAPGWGILLVVLWLGQFPDGLAAQTWFTNAFLPSTSPASVPAGQRPSFLQAGPILVDLAATAAIEYTDNVDFSPVGQPGTELSAGIQFGAAWQALRAVQLELTGSWLVNEWLSGHGPNQQTLTIAPGSTLRYTISVDIVQVIPFVNLSRTYDPSLAPTVGNTAIFQQSSYDGGLQVAVPMNHLRLELMGLRGLVISSGIGMGNTDTDRKLASARLVREFNPRLQAGVEYYAVAENFRNAPAERSSSTTERIFGIAQLTTNLRLEIALGLEASHYAQPVIAADSTRHTQMIGDLTLSDRVRQNLTGVLHISDQVADNFTTDYYRTLSVAFSAAFRFNPRTTFTLETNWQQIEQSVRAEGTGDFWRNTARFEYTVSDKLSLHLEARSLSNQVTAAGLGYRQNVLELGANRRF